MYVDKEKKMAATSTLKADADQTTLLPPNSL